MNVVEHPSTSGGDESASGVRRATLFKRIGITLGGLSAGGAAAAGLASASRSSGHVAALSSRDREVLEFALRLEYLQTAFYDEALSRGKLTGEVKQFAQVVGGEEREHLAYVKHALGHAGGPAPKFQFGDAATDDAKFVVAAAKLEDTGLAAYNGQAENISRATLKSVARVMSVEGRHAAWARSLAGQVPAPVPDDQPISASQALQAIKPYLA